MANAVINTAASGDVTLIAAPASPKMIRVYGYVLESSGSDTVYLAGGNDTIPLTGPFDLAAQTGVASGWYHEGIFDLPLASALLVHKAAAVQLSGHVRYEIIG